MSVVAVFAFNRAVASLGPNAAAAVIALVPVTADVQADLPKVARMFSQVQEDGNGEVPWWTKTRDNGADSEEHAGDRRHRLALLCQ